ncbi:MAG: zinc-ribbon domain-containing protein [Deltaproteobacteria bacterium]|nr:zinc-ribbon domain-containing protein [Deltaproteobacteria bacterium]
MIIHCSQCGTRYRFPGEKVKPGGTKVRCVRCGNVFRVMPEESVSPFEEVFEPQTDEISAFGKEKAPTNAVVTSGLFKGVPGARNGAPEHKPAQEKPEAAELEAQLETAREGAGEKAEELDEAVFFDDFEIAEGEDKDLSLAVDENVQRLEDEPSSVEPLQSQMPGDDGFSREIPIDIASPEPPKGGRSMIGRLFLLLFFLVVIVCSAIAGYLFWRGEPFEMASLMKIIQKPAVEAPKPAGKIHLKEGVTSFYVFNQEAGQMFVISGIAVNKFSEARSGISVKGILYDEKGRELRQQTVFCGNPFEKDALNDMPYKTIEENMNNQFGTTFSNLNIAPGKEIPFSIVFRNLPENLAEFSVEVVGSKATADKK